MNGAGQSPAEVTAAFLVHAERNWVAGADPRCIRETRRLAPLRSRADAVTGQAHPIVGADVPNINVDLPRVHMAGSDVHHKAHLEGGATRLRPVPLARR
jgi:hypothetical protein